MTVIADGNNKLKMREKEKKKNKKNNVISWWIKCFKTANVSSKHDKNRYKEYM